MHRNVKQLSRGLLAAWLAAAPLLCAGCRARGAVREVYVARHLNAGWEATLTGKAEVGVDNLERVLEVEPDHKEARKLMGRAYAVAKRFEEALPFLEECTSAVGPIRSPENFMDRLLLGQAYNTVGRYDDADRVWSALLEVAQTTQLRVEALNDIGYMLADSGRRLDEALQMTEQAVREAPNDGNIVDSLAWAHYKRGDFELAHKYLKRALELYPWHAELRYHQGMILLKLGRREEAKEALLTASALDPEHEETKKELKALGAAPKRATQREVQWKKQWWETQHALRQTAAALQRALSSSFSTR